MKLPYIGQRFVVLVPNRELLPLAVYEIEVGGADNLASAIDFAKELVEQGKPCMIQCREWKEVTTKEFIYSVPFND
jgi:hypothetical protein